MSKTTEPTCNSPPMGVLPTAAGNLQDSFPAYFASPDRFADLLNNTLLQECGEPPLDPRDLAPLDIHAGSYRFPAECWEQPTILMGVYYAGQPKTFGNLRDVFSLSCLSEPSGEEAVQQLRIVSSVRRWYMESSKDAEYQAALVQWETDAAAAKNHNHRRSRWFALPPWGLLPAWPKGSSNQPSLAQRPALPLKGRYSPVSLRGTGNGLLLVCFLSTMVLASRIAATSQAGPPTWFPSRLFH